MRRGGNALGAFPQYWTRAFPKAFPKVFPSVPFWEPPWGEVQSSKSILNWIDGTLAVPHKLKYTRIYLCLFTNLPHLSILKVHLRCDLYRFMLHLCDVSVYVTDTGLLFPEKFKHIPLWMSRPLQPERPYLPHHCPLEIVTNLIATFIIHFKMSPSLL